MTNSTGLKRLNKNTEKELLGHHFSEFMTQSIHRFRQENYHVFSSGNPLEFEDERDEKCITITFFLFLKMKKFRMSSHIVRILRNGKIGK